MLDKLAPSLGALALVWLAGAAIQALLPAPLERGRTARAGMAYLLGAAWLGLGLWASGFLFGASLSRTTTVVLLALPIVAAAVVAAIRRSLGGLEPRGETSRGKLTRVFGAVAVAVVAAQGVALFAHAAAEPVADFDGRMTWGTQARYLDAANDVLPDVLQDERAFVIHPRYPIELPLLQVATVRLAGASLDGFAVRPLYALFLPAFAAALWPTLRRAGGGAGAAFATLLLFAAPTLLGDRETGPFGTYSDYPLAAFLGVGFVHLVHPRIRREPWRGWPAGLLLAGAAGAKNEGMLLALAAIGAALLASTWSRGRVERRARLGVAARAALVVVAALGLIVTWRSGIPNRNDEGYFESFSLSTLLGNVPSRAGPLAVTLSWRSLDRANWGLLFWIAPFVLAAGARGLRRRAAHAAALLVVAELVLVLAAYLVVGDLAIVAVTWNRFVLQLTAPLALLLAASGGAVFALARASLRRDARHAQNAFGSSPPQY